MKCPRCDEPLKETSLRELGLTTDAHTCPTCQGYWINAARLQDIEATVDRKFIEFRNIPSQPKQLDELKCPQCAGSVTMDKVENQRDKKVIMDVCPQCKNIWLDGGEKQAIEKESFAALITDCFRWSKDG
jgi:Zn-finger nucleic acid-binding protein